MHLIKSSLKRDGKKPYTSPTGKSENRHNLGNFVFLFQIESRKCDFEDPFEYQKRGSTKRDDLLPSSKGSSKRKKERGAERIDWRVFSTYKRPQPWQAALESDLVPTMPRTRTWTSPYRSTPRPHSSSRSTRPRRPLFRYEGRQNPGAATVQPGHRYSENTPAMQRNKMVGNWREGRPRLSTSWRRSRVVNKGGEENDEEKTARDDLGQTCLTKVWNPKRYPFSLSLSFSRGEKWRLFDPLLHHF